MKISVALAQATQRKFTDDLTGYAEEIEKILSRSPETQMVVHPELHLFGSDMSIDALQEIAQSLDSKFVACLLYTSPSPRDRTRSRMPSSA